MSPLLPLFAALLIGPTSAFFGIDQYVNVQGRLLCHGKPAQNVTVLLGEYDWPDANDILSQDQTDKDGRYSLSGSETEAFGIQPFLAIAHFCQAATRGDRECVHIIYMNLPEKIVSLGEPPAQATNVADLHLEVPRGSQKKYCGQNLNEALATTKPNA